ncbi:putative replication factor C small subunit [Namao virus]|nr:putative replication factor C small subunit [Namao virus]
MKKNDDYLQNDIPWTEKYRPQRLDEIVYQPCIVKSLKRMIKYQNFPNMVFYGPPGTGKTSTILACVREIYGENYRYSTLELNSSSDRGINIVRDKIKEFISSSNNIYSIFTCPIKYRLIILDEADSMTYDAQVALRAMIKEYDSSVRFCIICNYITKIIDELKSRCIILTFKSVDPKSHLNILDIILDKEYIVLDTKDKKHILDKIIDLSQGDLRVSLNILHSMKLLKKSILYLTDLESLIFDSNLEINSLYENNGSVLEIYHQIKSSNLLDKCAGKISTVVEKIVCGVIKKIESRAYTPDQLQKCMQFFIQSAHIISFLKDSLDDELQILHFSAILYDFRDIFVNNK